MTFVLTFLLTWALVVLLLGAIGTWFVLVTAFGPPKPAPAGVVAALASFFCVLALVVAWYDAV